MYEIIDDMCVPDFVGVNVIFQWVCDFVGVILWVCV